MAVEVVREHRQPTQDQPSLAGAAQDRQRLLVQFDGLVQTSDPAIGPAQVTVSQRPFEFVVDVLPGPVALLGALDRSVLLASESETLGLDGQASGSFGRRPGAAVDRPFKLRR
ncbi:MAG: hypothetical protein ACRDK8_08725 [Solirubrobacteraceae bacterium]